MGRRDFNRHRYAPSPETDIGIFGFGAPFEFRALVDPDCGEAMVVFRAIGDCRKRKGHDAAA